MGVLRTPKYLSFHLHTIPANFAKLFYHTNLLFLFKLTSRWCKTYTAPYGLKVWKKMLFLKSPYFHVFRGVKGFSICLFSIPLLPSWSSVYHWRIPPASQNCMLFFHVSLHASPANESPRKLITKSTNSTADCQQIVLFAGSLKHVISSNAALLSC